MQSLDLPLQGPEGLTRHGASLQGLTLQCSEVLWLKGGLHFSFELYSTQCLANGLLVEERVDALEA